MSITTLSSRAFNSDVARAKRATARGPVFITDRGRPAHVLLSIGAYKKLRGGKRMSLLESLIPSNRAPLAEDVEFSKIGGITRPLELD